MHRNAVKLAASGLLAVLTIVGLSLCLPGKYSQADGPNAQSPSNNNVKSSPDIRVSGHPNIKLKRKVVRLPLPQAGPLGELEMYPNIEYEPGGEPAFEVVPGIKQHQRPQGVPTNNSIPVFPTTQKKSFQDYEGPLLNRVGSYIKDKNPLSPTTKTNRRSQQQPSFLETVQSAIIGSDPPKSQRSVAGKKPTTANQSLPVGSIKRTQNIEELPSGAEIVPPPFDLNQEYPESGNGFGEAIGQTIDAHCNSCDRNGWLGKLFTFGPGAKKEDIGIGHQRVMFAPFEIDYSQPLKNTRLRFNSAYRFRMPDRAEYLWSRSSSLGGFGPPVVEQSVDYQDLIFSFEAGSDRISVITELPIRSVDPVVNPNTTGFGDMSIATKTVMIDGDRWQITQWFKTYLKTGSSRRGTSAGHIALEPGFLIRRKFTDETYFHSEVKYRIPLGGNPISSGQVLKYGIGVSHILYESDVFAILPTLEFVGWTILDGQGTNFPLPTQVDLDSQQIFNIHPGLRMVADTGGDFGLFEFGISGGFAASTDRWYDGQLSIEARWSY